MKKFESVEFLKRELELDDGILFGIAREIFEYTLLKAGNGNCNGYISGTLPSSDEPYVLAAGDAARDFHHAIFVAEMRASGKEIKKV